MDNDASAQPIRAQDRKEERLPDELGPKVRASKSKRVIKPREDEQPVDGAEDSKNDEFYAEILQKFGIQI